MIFMGRSSYCLNAPRIEDCLPPGAVAAERAFLADRVRPLEDPVLPCGQPCEYFRFHRLRSAEAQVRFEAGEPVRREARALFEEDADLVVPIDVVESEGDEAELFGGFCIQHFADARLRDIE